MNAPEILHKKREGEKLSQEEIQFLVDGFSSGEIPDYQMAAFLMAIYFMGLDFEETYWLTLAMVHSGEVIDLSEIPGIKVDKHSTGGVGDKTTLVVAPIASACGVPIAKMSGRGLGFSGGTLDKLEAIPGFQTNLSIEDFISNVKEHGIAIISATKTVARADKLLYALRDVTDTVDIISLITASVMSKKLAAGSDAIVLDVKCGAGAFMKTEGEARELAQEMVKIGEESGKKMAALITDMSQPLGTAVGNSLEVIEAIQVLKGEGDANLTELCLQVASYMIFLGEKAPSVEEAYEMAGRAITDGTALSKFTEMVIAQKGDPNIVWDNSLFPKPAFQRSYCSEASGYVSNLDARKVGIASQRTGAGRMKKEDSVDLSAGVVLLKKMGDYVTKGEALSILYGNREDKLEDALEILAEAYEISESPQGKTPLIIGIIS